MSSLIISNSDLNGEAQASCCVAHGKKIIPCIEDIESCRIHIKECLDQPILNSHIHQLAKKNICYEEPLIHLLIDNHSPFPGFHHNVPEQLLINRQCQIGSRFHDALKFSTVSIDSTEVVDQWRDTAIMSHRYFAAVCLAHSSIPEVAIVQRQR